MVARLIPTKRERYRAAVVAVAGGRFRPNSVFVYRARLAMRKTEGDLLFDVEILRARLAGAIAARGRN